MESLNIFFTYLGFAVVYYFVVDKILCSFHTAFAYFFVKDIIEHYTVFVIINEVFFSIFPKQILF